MNVTFAQVSGWVVRYLLTIRISDILDIAIMAFVLYKIFTLVQSTKAVQVECPEHLDARHDRKWTSEALFNILDNAVKYTPAGGQIHVSVEGWEMYVKIDIADTGIGISEQHQGTIFKRFYREDAVHDVDGIGIGLYLAREIVTLQGGYIWVVSEVGKGSTFSVFLLRK